MHVSASDLRKLLQNNADNFTSRYLNVNDFAVTEDLRSCYEHVWTLSWSTQVGDLPNFIRVCMLVLWIWHPGAILLKENQYYMGENCHELLILLKYSNIREVFKACFLSHTFNC